MANAIFLNLADNGISHQFPALDTTQIQSLTSGAGSNLLGTLKPDQQQQVLAATVHAISRVFITLVLASDKSASCSTIATADEFSREVFIVARLFFVFVFSRCAFRPKHGALDAHDILVQSVGAHLLRIVHVLFSVIESGRLVRLWFGLCLIQYLRGQRQKLPILG
ncbi:hypothetical protein BDV23DRAFT_181273 [Aspergillus alliaceus]|uniref:Uncharacterized protein n=1 Tax=Petromyces alliaceus TaxID=209559 RepID=A0A5N7CGG6_PETAA|nr:hypothetical protein BDV23DRAFT_181273 [Aspergillus alliaceus]